MKWYEQNKFAEIKCHFGKAFYTLFKVNWTITSSKSSFTLEKSPEQDSTCLVGYIGSPLRPQIYGRLRLDTKDDGSSVAVQVDKHSVKYHNWLTNLG